MAELSLTEKHRILVERLYRKTQSREISWEYISSAAFVRARVGKSFITLVEETNFEERPVVIVRVFGEDNTLLEQFDDESLAGRLPELPGVDGYWSMLKSLIQIAKRQATGADQALDNLLDELDDDIA